MARRSYPPEFRRRVVDLVEGGRRVAEVAVELSDKRADDLHLAPPGTDQCWRRSGPHDEREGQARGDEAAHPRGGDRACDSSPGNRAAQGEERPKKNLRGDPSNRRGGSSRRCRVLGIGVLRMAQSSAFAEVAPPCLAHCAHRRCVCGVPRHLRHPCMQNSRWVTESRSAERPWGG